MPRFTKPVIGSYLLLAAVTLQACSVGPARPASQSVAAQVPNAGTQGAEQPYQDALNALSHGELGKAKQLLMGLTQSHPHLSGPWTNLGILYANSQELELAISHFEKACAANPGNITALNWLGSLRRRQRQYLLAEAAYLKALRSSPDDAASHLNLALLYDTSLHRTEAALKHYQRYQDLTQGDRLVVQAWMNRLSDQRTAQLTGVSK